MSTISDVSRAENRTGADPANRLKASMTAMRLSFTSFGVRKSLTQEQKSEAAEAFGAEGDVLSAGKRLINTKHPKFRAVTRIRSRAVGLWKSISLPFPEPGIRLIKREDITTIDAWMANLKGELHEAVFELDDHFAELKTASRERLGRLYSESDYPDSFIGLFDIDWDWPSVEPPPYLRQLSPQLFEAESQRARARFDEAIQLAENAFLDELNKLVQHLTERLSGSDDGRPKVFRDSAVENLESFFQRFRQLNIGSSEELDALVSHAQEIVRGVQPQQLRDDGSLRQQVASQMAAVQANLDQLLVDRPRRNILRRPR